MPIPDTQIEHIEVVVRGSLAAGGASVKNCWNVFHYHRTTLVNPFSKTNFAAAFRTAVIVPLVAAANARYTVNRLSVRIVNDAFDPYQDIADAGVGAIATDSEPNNDAVYVLMKTAARGRQALGSKHFGGSSEVDTTDNILVGAGLARWQAVQAAVALSFNDASPNTFVPTVLSRSRSSLLVNPTFVWATDVVTTLLNKRIGSMVHRRAVSVY